MTTWFVSRHPGALHWISKNGVHYDIHASHLDTDKVKAGDKVIGSLPINLAALVCKQGAEYWHLSLIIPPKLRGVELSAEQLDAFNATLERYEVTKQT